MSLIGLRILLVEDELLIRELFEFTLKMYHAEVKTAGNVSEATEIIRSWTPQVVVTDIGLPEVDGYSLIKILREMPGTKHIPIFTLSGYVANSDEQNILEDPNLFRISKPVDPEYLIKVIEEKT